MYKTTCRISTVLFLCIGVVLLSSHRTPAQIAPTNSATISGSVSDASGKPVAHALVSLSGPKTATTQTDTNGLFVFIGVPFGTYSIAAAAGGFGTATRTGLSVQGDTNVAIQYEPMNVSGLKVIANVASVSHANFNVTAASITQVNPMQAAFNGVTSWRKILAQIPGVSMGSLNAGQLTLTQFPDAPIVPTKVSINGTLPYETAVLFDGMPVISASYASATGTGTNLSLYPMNAFSSADVVRGPGANSPSIVDSIGGSLALHAPGPVSQNQTVLSLSTDPYGGIVANALVAARWNKLSATITYGVNDSPGPFTSTTFAAKLFSNVGQVNGQYCACTIVSSDLGYPNPNYYSSTGLYGYVEHLSVCCLNQNSAWSAQSGALSLNYAISPKINATIFYSGARSLMQLPNYNVAVQFAPPAGYTGSLPAGTYLMNSGPSGALNGAPIVQSSSMLEEKVTAQLGRGLLTVAALQNKTFSYEPAAGPGTASLQLYGGAALCATSTPTCGSAGNPGTFTVFNGATYPVAFLDAIGLTEYYGDHNRDFTLSYATALGANARIGASFVQSYADYNCTFLEAETPLVGSPSVFADTLPSGVSQTTNEMRIFAGINPSEKTSLDLSGYFVNLDYHFPNPNAPSASSIYTPGANLAWTDSRFTYAAPRLGFVWRPTTVVAVRAAVGGGFAESPLTNFIGSNPLCASNALTCGLSVINTNLQPEKSFGFDVGTDIRLHRNMTFSFDLYRTNLFGQFYTSSTFAGIGTCPGNTTAPCYVTEAGNIGVSRYEGVLLDIRHDAPRGIYWAFSGGLTRGYVVSVPAGFYNSGSSTCNFTTGSGCTNLTVVPGINFNGTFAAAIPYSQGLGTLGYRWQPEKYADLVATYYGNNNSYFRPAFVELDGHLAYPVTRNISLLMTFRNITGIYDAPIVTYGPAIAEPQLGGLPPYGIVGQNVGVRSVILTMSVHSK